MKVTDYCFQAGLIRESPTKEFLEDYARVVLQKSLESLYACGGGSSVKLLFTLASENMLSLKSLKDNFH